MSLFSLENILVNEETSSTVPLTSSSTQSSSIIDIDDITTNTSVEDCDFMREAYSFILDYTREYNNANKTFYKNILESCGDQGVINESFSDFFSKIKEIIKKFLDFIKRIFSQFSAKLHSLFKGEKYLNKNKNEFVKFTSEDEFEFSGYKFTHLEDVNVPLSDAQSAYFASSDSNNGMKDNFNDLTMKSIDDERNKLTSDTSMSDDKRQSDLQTFINNRYEALNDQLDDFYDWFRGHVIGTDKKIDSSDFENELFELFRDGDSEASNITIDSNFVNDAWFRFSGYKKLIKSIEDTRKTIEKDYTSLQKALEKSLKMEKEGDGVFFKFDPISGRDFGTAQSNLFYGEGDTQANNKRVALSSGVYNKIDMYMKAKVNQVQQMSNIHTLAFTAKIQATKDCFVQDKKILYKALAKIKGHKTTI